MTRSTYDEKCYDLAVLFLADEPDLFSGRNAHDMACDIQQAIEDWFAEARERARIPEADARLIAAAPDMFDSLRDIVALARTKGVLNKEQILQIANPAICRATGEA